MAGRAEPADEAGRMAVRSSASRSRPMNELMRSVADIPGDADDDLAEISPELVLVDPELARRMREEAAAAVAAARSRDRALRLVGELRGWTIAQWAQSPRSRRSCRVARYRTAARTPTVGSLPHRSSRTTRSSSSPRSAGPAELSAPEVFRPIGEPEVQAPSLPDPVIAGLEPESALVPGAVPTVSEPVGERKVEAANASQEIVATPEVVADDVPESGLVPGVVPTMLWPAREPEVEVPSSPEAILVPTTVPAVAEAASEVARRVVDAEPARVVAPRPGSAFPVTVPGPAEMAPEPRPRATLTPAMSHPIVRTDTPLRTPIALRGPRRGRGAIAFLASVAVASMAVLGILNLTGGSSSSGSDALPATG